jgi:peptidyl-prolyl cis-trans isomerase A (cyclophilin A)
MIRHIILAALLALHGPLDASAPQSDLVPVAIDTGLGRIIVALDRGRAPLTTANFLAYVDSGKLDGEKFYRAMPYGEGGLVQGGITSDARKLAGPVAHEPVAQTGISHKTGTISMANFGPGTAKADFFILTTDIPAFDSNFAAFGQVVEGMDVVKAILASPVSPAKGEGPMKGQMLDPAVRIVKAERVKD